MPRTSGIRSYRAPDFPDCMTEFQGVPSEMKEQAFASAATSRALGTGKWGGRAAATHRFSAAVGPLE